MATPIIIDCDPGIDDSVSILLALASPEVEVLGISVVCGNIPLERTIDNALKVCELAGRPDIAVYGGAARPLIREPLYGEFSGETGLGSVNLPTSSHKVEAQHAVDFLVSRLLAAAKSGQRITLCTQGPLTNVALALRHTPAIANGIERIVMMGGAYRESGNRTMAAEFNILADPHAAHIVLSSAVPIVALPLDATFQAIATPERVARIRSIGNPVSGIVADLLTFWDRKDVARYGSLGGPLHDPLVIAYVLRPDLFKSQRARVFVEYESKIALGQTIADWWNKSGEAANVDIVGEVNADGFFDLLCERLARYP